MTTKLRVTPMIGEVQRGERLNTLSRCHAITERGVRKYVVGSGVAFDTALGAAVRELLLADRAGAALTGKAAFIVEIEVE